MHKQTTGYEPRTGVGSKYMTRFSKKIQNNHKIVTDNYRVKSIGS